MTVCYDEETGEDRVFKWEIEPHPYNSSDYDTFVCDDDQQACDAIMAAAEAAWDQMEEGEEKIIVIRRNKVPQANPEANAK